MCNPVDLTGVFFAGLLLDKGQLPLIADNSLWSNHHNEYKQDSDQDEAQGSCLAGGQASEKSHISHRGKNRSQEGLEYPEDHGS